MVKDCEQGLADKDAVFKAAGLATGAAAFIAVGGVKGVLSAGKQIFNDIKKTVKGFTDIIGITSPDAKEDKVPEDDPTCKSDGITNSGVMQGSAWKAVVNGGILAMNTANSLRMAHLQRCIGESYLGLAEEQRQYHNNRYKPLELDIAKEALSRPLYNRNKDMTIAGQMLISARNLTAGKLDKALACTGRYCTGQRAAMVTSHLLEQSAIESLTAGLAHRYVDRDEITHNNLRWEKREQALKVGRDLPTQALSYASMAAGIFGSIGRQAGQAAEGAMSFLAYGRNDTVYPERRGPITISDYGYDIYKGFRNFVPPNDPKPANTAKTPTIRVSG